MLNQLKKDLRQYTLDVAVLAKRENDQCWIDGCTQIGISVGYVRSRDLFVWGCPVHIGELVREDNPEYFIDCPACGCDFGVN